MQGRATAISTTNFDYSECTSTVPCSTTARYSTSNWGPSGDDNTEALDAVARSVANYRAPVSCSLSRPVKMRGFVTNDCNFETFYTEYTLLWDDVCPEETDFYEIEVSTVSAFGPYYPNSPPFQTLFQIA